MNVDGVLDEPVWQRAALLTGFSLYSPVDSTAGARLDRRARLVFVRRDLLRDPRVRVARPSERDARRPRSHLRGRQRRDPSRHVRRAQSRVRVHRQPTRRAGRRDEERSGRLHPRVERHARAERSERRLRVAVARTRHRSGATRSRSGFRSAACVIRSARPQQWGLQIDRHVQHNGYEETWTPAKRASASFIGQAGWLTGLTGHAARADRRDESGGDQHGERHAVLLTGDGLLALRTRAEDSAATFGGRSAATSC